MTDQRNEMANPWKLLGVHRMSTDAEVRAEYLSLAKTMHPDAGGSVEAMASLGAAYKLLATVAARAQLAAFYDCHGKPCGVCKGFGATAKGRGITKVSYYPCDQCGGAGTILTKEINYESIKLLGVSRSSEKWRDKSK